MATATGKDYGPCLRTWQSQVSRPKKADDAKQLRSTHVLDHRQESCCSSAIASAVSQGRTRLRPGRDDETDHCPRQPIEVEIFRDIQEVFGLLAKMAVDR